MSSHTLAIDAAAAYGWVPEAYARALAGDDGACARLADACATPRARLLVRACVIRPVSTTIPRRASRDSLSGMLPRRASRE